MRAGSMPSSATRQSSAEIPGCMRASNPASRTRRIASCDGSTKMPGMAVEGRANLGSAFDCGDDLVGDRPVEVVAVPPRPVVPGQRARVRAQSCEPGLRDGLRHQVEDDVGTLDRRAGLGRDVHGNLDPGADDGE